MRKGGRIECVARWLGHRTPMVTYQHYWTDPAWIDLDAEAYRDSPEGHSVSGDDEATPAVGGERTSPSVGCESATATALDQEMYCTLEAKIRECEELRRQLRQATMDGDV